MIIKNGNELFSRRKGSMIAVRIMKGATLVWEAVRSCFGAGYWKNEAPWINNEAWKN